VDSTLVFVLPLLMRQDNGMDNAGTFARYYTVFAAFPPVRSAGEVIAKRDAIERNRQMYVDCWILFAEYVPGLSKYWVPKSIGLTPYIL
jgi:hypothetical protein